MRAVVYNKEGSTIGLSSDSLTVRCAFLLGEEITIMGDVYYFIDFENWMNVSKIDMKLIAVYQMQLMLGETPPIPYTEQQQILKSFRKIKHVSGEGINIFKNWEKGIENLFVALKKEVAEMLEKNGTIQLKPLLKSKFLFAVTSNHVNPEERDKKNYLTPVSEMLTLEETFQKDLDEASMDISPVFFLPPEFICDVKIVFKTPDIFNDLVQPKAFYSQTLISFPNLNYATAQELLNLRNSISLFSVSFHSVINQWIKKVKECDSEAQNFFSSNVIPVCKIMQEKIDSLELIEYLKLIDEKKGIIEITAGECLFNEIWIFFDSVKAIPEKTKPVLELFKKKDKKYTSRQPFFACNYRSGISRKEVIIEREGFLSSKKYLNLD